MMTKDFTTSFNLISHSEPNRKLVVHLDEVYKKAKSRFDELEVNFAYLNISKEGFEELLKIVVYCHDFGKSSIYFQKKITGGLTKGKEVEEKKLSEHGLISAFFGYFVAIEKFDRRLASFVFMAIRYHHLNLDNSEEMQKVDEDSIENVLKIFEYVKPNKNEIDKLYQYFLGIENGVDKFENFLYQGFPKDEFEYRDTCFFWYRQKYEENDIFIFMLLFSLLIYADKQDAIFRDKELVKTTDFKIDSDKVEEFKNAYFKTREKTPLDETREKIYQSIVEEFNSTDENEQLVKDKSVFFVKLPTGAGKTLLLYKLAMILQEKKQQKVFYLLPFITLIEQNADILKSLLDFMDIDSSDHQIFLEKHSLSGEFEISDAKDEYDIDAKEFLLDTLESQFIVTSFHQLFYGVFKRKNALLKRFHQFSNSIILIDEVQLIPLEHMYVITQFLKFMSEIFNCKIIVASATFPNIKKEILQNSHTFKEIDKILTKKEINTFFNRYKINIDFSQVYCEDSLYKKVDEKLLTRKDLLFRVNTVNIANDIYEYVLSINSEYQKNNIFLLTSAVAPKVRKYIIKRIKRNTKRGIKQIVVATQLIQAGVDISLEDGFEELAPLDLIVQSMGRRNRSAEKMSIGEADVIKIARIINGREFEGHKIYNEYDINETIEILSKYESISEKEIYEDALLDQFYNAQPEQKKIDKEFQALNFKNIDESFVLIKNAPLSFSFFVPLDKKSLRLWNSLKELDRRKKQVKQDKYFWKNIKLIESEYSKIKKDVSLYTVNQNFYYQGTKQEITKTTITEDFDKALGIYLATEDVFERCKGLQLAQFIKDKIEGLFW
jgi:CRISPR-associated endonuclease/helicase Cas3